MKFSIITITYNSEKTIKDTLESVLKQTYRPLQYVLIDGVSKDSTLKIIESYKKKFDSVGIEYIFKSEIDSGISDAFNKGIRLANGDIIGIINSDDKLYSNALELLAKEYHPEIGVYFGDCIIFNNNHRNNFVAIPHASKNMKLLEIGMAIYHPSTFINKNVYKDFGGYEVELKYCMDRELLLRLYKKKVKFKYIHEPLAYYREGGVNQVNSRKCAKENMLVSIKYGMNPTEAEIRRMYFKLHDNVWYLIQKIGFESLFHGRVN